LANERTLLAWLRTALAIVRTAFALIGISAAGGWWLSTVYATRLCMVTAILVAMACGVRRYQAIKVATFMPTPPQDFGRLSIHYMNATLCITVLAIVLGLYADAWIK